jgi:zinc finger protein
MEQLANQLNSGEKVPEVVYIDTRPDEATVIESVCIQCEENGETRLLLTKIPFFQDIVVISFSCPHCGYRNNEIQAAATLEDYASKVTLRVICKEDLERDIVRSNFCHVSVPELQLEIPATGKGFMSTLEGVLTSFKEDLELNQPWRKDNDPEAYPKIEEFIHKLDKYLACDPEILPFHLIMDDPSGHSFIKNFNAPLPDPQLTISKYTRTSQQLIDMGYTPENVNTANQESTLAPIKEELEDLKDLAKQFDNLIPDNTKHHKYTAKETEAILAKLEQTKELYKGLDMHGYNLNKDFDHNTENIKEESLEFVTNCHNCKKEGVTRMCTCEIPFFKELIVMAFTCTYCGSRSSEVKTGGGVPPKGKRMVFSVDGREQLDRDIFKSESAEVTINELGLTITAGSMGGLYSTVEGLLMKLVETFRENNPFVGDSADVEFTDRFNRFVDKVEKFQAGEEKFTLIIDDPLDNSWIMNPLAP